MCVCGGGVCVCVCGVGVCGVEVGRGDRKISIILCVSFLTFWARFMVDIASRPGAWF